MEENEEQGSIDHCDGLMQSSNIITNNDFANQKSCISSTVSSVIPVKHFVTKENTQEEVRDWIFSI